MFCIRLLNADRKQDAAHLFIEAEYRSNLLQHMAVCYQTDYMWRLGRVTLFPKYEKPLSEHNTKDVGVAAFCGRKKFEYQGYSFFLGKKFRDVPNAVMSTTTGLYADDNGVEVVVHVHDPVLLSQLKKTIEPDV